MSALEQYRIKIGKRKGEPWAPPTPDDFLESHALMCFDQALAATAWVALEFFNGRILVPSRGMIRTKTTETGVLGTILKARQLEEGLQQMGLRDDFDEVVVETPAVHGHRTESSLMALREVIRFFDGRWTGPITMMPIQHSRTLLAGREARDDKKAGHRALAEWIPESVGRTWNEHQRDGAINGLGRLIDLKRSKDDG